MKISFILRHPGRAFNRAFICSFWGHDDPQARSWWKDGTDFVVMRPAAQICERCKGVC